MKKWLKLLGGGGLTVLLLAAVAMFMPVYAAAGWQKVNPEEENSWVYVMEDGSYLRNAWKRSGGQYYYLDENGEMAVDSLIDFNGDKYYVDEHGVRAVKRWAAIPKDPDETFGDDSVDTIYYYFDQNGKAYTDTKRTIEGKMYIFDEESRMLSGWQTYRDEDDLYYLGTGDEGWVHTGWQWLMPKEGIDTVGEEMKWFYFHLNNGKAYRGKRYINGNYYNFDQETAAMIDRWVEGTPGAPDYSAETGTVSNAFYEPEEGRLKTGWVYTYDPEDTEKEEKYWFYLDKHGAAFNEGGKDTHYGEKVLGDSGDSLYTYMAKGLGGENGATSYTNLAAKVIDGKTYLFDENGHMMTGFFYLWVIKREGSSVPLGERKLVGNNYGYGGGYYFNDEKGSPKEGQMMSGRFKLDKNFTKDYYHFSKTGKAYERAIINGYLYLEGGVNIAASDGNKYRIVDIEAGEYLPPITEQGSSRVHGDCQMIVDANGRVKKNGTVIWDGYRYTVKNYEIVSKEPE